MIVSSEADEVLREIRQLRADRQQRLRDDLTAIDAAYDRQLRRVRGGAPGSKSAAPFPFVKSICARSRYCVTFKRRLRRLTQRGD